jgi:hypothetical protein
MALVNGDELGPESQSDDGNIDFAITHDVYKVRPASTRNLGQRGSKNGNARNDTFPG